MGKSEKEEIRLEIVGIARKKYLPKI